MTNLKEQFHDFAVDDEGEIVPLEDTPYDERPASNAFRTQGIANLEARNAEQSLIEEAEKKTREEAVANAALQKAGVYVTLDERRQDLLELVDIASDLSMYRGGEKGGYQAGDFQGRYASQAAQVEAGARRNHKKRVNQDLPRIYRANELEAAGFSAEDIKDDITQMRSQLMSRYGGPENKNTRAKRRAELR